LIPHGLTKNEVGYSHPSRTLKSYYQYYIVAEDLDPDETYELTLKRIASLDLEISYLDELVSYFCNMC
jgi:hypothetical protein